MKILNIVGAAALSLAAQMSYAGQCMQISDRWSLADETMAVGETITVSVGGYDVSYTTNQNSTNPADWQWYLAMAFNEQVPAHFARMGDVDNNYQPSGTVDNLIDVFVDGIPMAVTRSLGTPASVAVVSESVPPVTSTGSTRSPMFMVTSSSWAGIFNLTNVSDVPVTVKHKLTDASGNPFSASKLTHYEAYSSSNSPFGTSGAVLQPGEMGSVVINDSSETRINIGTISWEADACIDEALVATFRNSFNGGSKYSSVHVLLNNGEAF